MIQLGMSWWQAWICVWVGFAIVTPFLVLNARPGAVFHITFPVVIRTSFGVYGSLWCVFNRGAMAWYGNTHSQCLLSPRVEMKLQYMVWRASKHRRDVRVGDVTGYLA